MKTLKYNLIYRCIVIVWMAIKFIFKIYFFYFRHSIWDNETMYKWNRLLAKMAKEYRVKAERLGGVLIKVGQFLSTRTDFMPDVFIRELTKLVDHVPPMPFDYADKMLKQEWGTSIDTYLKSITKSSIASASIGEVYRAVLKDGTAVAIKVRRKRIEEIFHKDFIALRIVFWILKVFTNFGKKADLKALYSELVYVMDRELDLKQELEYGKYFKERYQDNPSIHIPFYIESLSTEKILVMEWIEGAKITDIHYLKSHHINVEQTTKVLFDFYMDQFMNPGKFHADPHAGNILMQKDGTIAIIDFGMVGEIKKQDTEQFKILVQGFIIDNYDIVVDALDKMNFILPNADKKKLKKVIKETVELYQNGSLKNFNAKAMEKLMEEIRVIIKDQPIQLPADYAYLIRAIAIVVGILFAINPETDIIKWAKPKIKDWFGTGQIIKSITKQYAKDASEPFLSYPRALLSFLESGEKNRTWDKEKEYYRLRHHFYLLIESISFIMVVIGIVGAVYGLSTDLISIGIIGLSLIGVFMIIINIILVMHYRMIRSRK
ncbi:ABC1 kinase family protein [Oceanobacillus chungangensis]|uniref:ABC transporter n=1 Tax=Oceanobacillus chungangensis TaxID=1229152 RepID=A0A3D8PWI8_9BACI|nr:AarF/UbiB family protein [Oceanobacillus chungangensis]RDW20496.1 ABC transporter [Oceanobacillus chungangensis]